MPTPFLSMSRIALALSLLAGALAAQQPPVPTYDAKAIEAAKAVKLPELLALREAFVKATSASGITCSIAAPTLVIEDTPSFGNYDPETNTLHTGVWEQLQSEERGIFFRLAGPGAKELAARREFETGAHHWVFVHEMGHWWQACRKVNDARKPYIFEYEADRIAAAYWHENDPAIARHMDGLFQGIVHHSPNPVPKGQHIATYFNDNYEKLGPTPAYIWFQSQMCVTAFAEKPAPSFVQTLRETGKP